MEYEFHYDRIYILLFKKTKTKLFVLKVMNENHKNFLIKYLENKKSVNKRDLYYKYGRIKV